MDLNDFIYDSVPDDVQTDFSDDSKNWLRQKFFDSPNKLFKSSDLEKDCGFKNNVSMRKAITELIENELIPIIATSKGYMLTTFKQDIDTYVESLESRIKGIQRRIDALRKAQRKING